tara:strand:- start:232 stop:627 length:396 start_codon:yes stop_codon:yes gene_type:complete
MNSARNNIKANDIAYGDDTEGQNETKVQNEGLPKLYAGSDIKIYSEGDYYHSIERFCNTKNNLYLHSIGRKPRLIGENLLNTCSSKPEQPTQTSLESSEQSNFYSFSDYFKNINYSEVINNWIQNCRDYWS